MRGAATAITIRNMSPEFADQAAEDEGIWTNGGSDTVIYGSVHQKASEDVDDGTTGQMSEQRNIICRVPLTASITYGDQVVIANVNPVINGIYEVDSLMYTKTHVRAECRRTIL